MMKRILTVGLVFCFILLALPVEKAQAIPAFARKYKFSCNTCHVAVPKLKAYGDEFAGNGFKIPDGEEPKRAYIDTGDESLLLSRDLPVAIRFDAFLQAADRDEGQVDIQAPFGVKLLSGGPLSDHVSYYFYFYISERGEVVGLEDAFLFFSDIGNTGLNLTLGQFQVCDPLFKRELRLTFEDYKILTVKPGEIRSGLTYDRGIVIDYGFDFGLDLIAQIVNGNGIKPADEDTKVFDNDNNKNFAFRASQELGMFRVGGFVYSGKETGNALDPQSMNPLADVDNETMIYGPDFTVGNDNFELNVEYLMREDTNPTFTDDEAKVKTDGGFVELFYFPKGDQSLFIFGALYNFIESDDDMLDYETATLHVSHMAARNLRVLGELTYDMKNEVPRFTLGFVSAF